MKHCKRCNIDFDDDICPECGVPGDDIPKENSNTKPVNQKENDSVTASRKKHL